MRALWAVSLASIYGLTVRVLFGFFGTLLNIMSISFLIIVPLAIGYITVSIINRKKKISGVAAFFYPCLTSLVLLIITTAINMEGFICWAMIFPVFAFFAGIGGLMARNFKVGPEDKDSLDDDLDLNDNNSSLKTVVLLVLPLLLGLVEGERSLISRQLTIKESIVINASDAETWDFLTSDIYVEPGEKKTSVVNFLSFPQHLYTTLDTAAIGGKRVAYYQKGLYFEETITEYIPQKKLALAIHVDPEKVPTDVMDEHIVIGGKYIDLQQDIYEFKNRSDGNIEISLTSYFTINTPLNIYVKPWADFVMKDLVSGELKLIKERVESRKQRDSK